MLTAKTLRLSMKTRETLMTLSILVILTLMMSSFNLREVSQSSTAW